MAIEDNVNDGKAARNLHRTIGRLLAGEVPLLPSDQSRRRFWELMRESIEKKLLPATESTKPAPVSPASNSHDEACEMFSEIEDLVANGNIPDAGYDFATSVLEKATEIIATVERIGSATDGQLAALENMLEGLSKWFH